jgi:hypothetical protein
MCKEPSWIEQDALEIIKELRGARYVSMHEGYGDYDLPGFIISTLESFLQRAGVEVPDEDEDEEEEA